MTDNLYANNRSMLFSNIYIRADTVNDIGLDIVGKTSISGNIVPTSDQTYSLGSSSIAWKDVYIGPGSLYINKKKIITDVSNIINISTEINQDLKIKTTGTGSLQLKSAGTGDIIFIADPGNIKLNGIVEVQATKKLTSSDGNGIKFGNGIVLDTGENITLSGGGKIIGAGGGGNNEWLLNELTLHCDKNVGFGIDTPLNTIHSNGAIIIGNTVTNVSGSIRWTGSDFEGYNGNTWLSLTSQPSNNFNDRTSSIGGLFIDGDMEITGTFTKNGGTDLIEQINTNKTDITSKTNISSPTFIGTVTGNNFILTGTLTKSTLLEGADLLAQIATNKEDIATEKSRIDEITSLTNEDLITFNNIVSAYESVDTGITSVLFTLQSNHITDITNLQDTKQDKGIFTQDLIPSADNEYSIGSPEFRIRDMYISENSLWIGDTHKICISDGKIKFRKRKTDAVPAAVLTASNLDASETAAAAIALAGEGINTLAEMKLIHWKNYMRTLTGNETAKISDIFRNDSSDYEEDNNIDDYQDAIPQVLQNGPVGDCCLLYTSPSPRDGLLSRMPSSA